MGTNIKVTSEAHWHELRAHHIGGSEIAALMGVDSFTTPYTLYQVKSGKIEDDDLSDNVRVLCGQHLEAGIAKVFADIHDLDIQKVHRYIEDDKIPGFGCSLDFEVRTETDGWVPLEIKMADYSVWKSEWDIEDEHLSHDRILTNVEAPLKYGLQVQAQMAVTNKPYGFIGVMVGGNKPYLIKIERHEAVIGMMREKVQEFWLSIAAGEEPEPQHPDDLDAVKKLYPQSDPLKIVDMSNSAELIIAAQEMAEQGEIRKLAEKAEKAAKAKVMALCEDASVVDLGDDIGKLKFTNIKANPGKEITQDMVGTVIGAKKASRRLTFSKPKPAKLAAE